MIDPYRESDDTTLWSVTKSAAVTSLILLTLWAAVVLSILECTK